MVALAFNSSTPIVYYNAEMFEAAGLDHRPRTGTSLTSWRHVTPSRQAAFRSA